MQALHDMTNGGAAARSRSLAAARHAG